MPDLGRYATEVLLAYGSSLALLAALVGVSWRSWRASKRALAAEEARRS